MSCLTKPHIKYLSNNDQKEKFYLADDDEDNFDFQYVPVNQFKHVIKDVKRQRIRDEEERVWSTFLKEQEQTALNYDQTCNSYKCTRTLAESIQDVDRELMRLEADSLPETYLCNSGNNVKNTEHRKSSVRSDKKDSSGMKENGTGTGSTNFLLTIPEEEKTYRVPQPTELLKECKNYIRKSCSDQTCKIKRINPRCYHYSTHNLDCNSTSELSLDRLSNDSIPVRPDSVVVTKMLGIQRRIFTVLESISYELDRIPLPDGENDLHRRQQRVVEFSTRLSRNYLYNLGRQIADIQRHIKAITPKGKIILTRRGIILHMQAIEQKLINAHQLLLTALNAYWKHIPSSVLKNHPGKLKEILDIVLQLKNICTEIHLTHDLYCTGDDVLLGNETENLCSVILSKFRSASDNESQIPSCTARQSAIITPSRRKKQRNRKTLSNRLSMYTMDLRLAKNYQPKKSQSLFQISRDKKHNCSLLKQQQSNMSVPKNNCLPIFTKSSNESQPKQITKITIPMKEDDIHTIMETVPSDADIESLQSNVHKESNKIHKNTKDSERLKSKITNIKNITMGNDCNREKCFSSLLPVIGDWLLSVQGKQNDSKSNPPVSIDTLYDFFQNHQSKDDTNESQTYKIQNEIHVGEKNMRLICYSEKEDNEEKKLSRNFKETKDIIKHNDVSCQANHLKSSGNCKLSVSATAADCLIDYRNQYQNLVKSNPMYTSNTQNKPWEIVAWIADKLVNELIVELSDDFQMEGVIKKLLDLEFREF